MTRTFRFLTILLPKSLFLFSPIRHRTTVELFEAAIALYGYLIEGIVEGGELVIRQVDIPCTEVFKNTFLILRAGYGYHILVFV